MAEIAGLVCLDHLSDAAVGEDVSRVDQPVEHLGRLLYLTRINWFELPESSGPKNRFLKEILSQI